MAENVCDSFYVARPDNPLAEPICFRCRQHLREHTDQLAQELQKATNIIGSQPLWRALHTADDSPTSVVPEVLAKAGAQMGYRFETTIEDGQHTVRLIRPDGSVAMIARKKVTHG